MPANTLTRKELQKLAEEATALADWTTVRDFANQMYGEGKATKVELETYGEYNDEGGTDYHISAITAYDKDGHELHFDYGLPFFAMEGWKGTADCVEANDEEGFDRFKEIYMTGKDEQRGNWILLEDLPVDEHEGTEETYDLTSPPVLTLLPA